MNSNDLLAKLLANENLTIVRGNVTTASFQIEKRLLVLPQWQGIQNVTEEMLILHEVGHALYTSLKYATAQQGKEAIFGHYLNVIEDARIERKIKHRYPGSRKSFIQGYKDLMDRDFFKIKDTNINELSFIDRINLFYKAGMNCGVKFNSSEFEFIKEIDKADSIDDVIDIANRLFDYCKANAEDEIKMEMMDELIDSSDDEEEYDDEDDLDEQLDGGAYASKENDMEGDGALGATDRKQQLREELIEKKMSASTVKSLENNLESAADSNTNYQYFEPEFAYSTDDKIIIEFKQVLSEMKESVIQYNDKTVYPDSIDFIYKQAIEFRKNNNSIVNNMVKEFEMRKSASAWKRAQVAKTGQLDPKKLFSYKIKDELFKQLTIVKDGKRHGMVMLLDWSGSMDSYMSNTINQVINLVMFARRINIPFKVFAFTSNYERTIAIDTYNISKNVDGLGFNTDFSLLELFSNNMNERQINEMTSYLLYRVWYKSHNFALSGTPLNEALMFMTKYMDKFIKNNSVEKAIFITLTDGEGGGLRCNDLKSLNSHTYKDVNGRSLRLSNKSYIKDSITGKQYVITNDSHTQTSALLNIIRDRYNTINIGFNLITNNYTNIQRFIGNTSNVLHNAFNTQVKLRSKRYTEFPLNGYTKYYLVDNKAISIQNDTNLDNVNSYMNANQVSKTLSKAMNKNKTSRVILNNFVVEIA